MGRQVLKILQASIAGQAGGVAHQAGGGGVVGMLILIGVRSQHDAGLKPANLGRNGESIFGAVTEVAIAASIQRMIEKMVQEADFGSDDAGGSDGFLGAFLGRAVTSGLAFRKHGDPDLVPVPDLLDQDGSAAELDVVGMGPYGQNLHVSLSRAMLQRPILR